MRKGWFMTLLTLSVWLVGCEDRYELEERAIILGLAVDLADDEDKEKAPKVTHEDQFPDKDTLYKVTAQLAVPGKIKLGPEGGGGQGSDKTSWVLVTYGYTMEDAMSNLQQQLAERLYLGHLQIIVVSEGVAKQGLSDVNDYLRRDHEVRRTAWLVVNKEDAAKVLEAAPPLETVPSLYLSDTLDNAVRFGKLPREYLGKFWIDMSDLGVDGLLPAIEVVNEDRIMVDGIAYFQGEKMVGKSSPIEIGAYMALKEKNPGGYSVAIALDNGVYMVKSTKRESKINVDLQGNTPSVRIEVKIDAEITEEVNKDNLGAETIRRLEEAANQNAKELYEKLLKKLQEDGSDILGIGGRVRAKFGSYWDQEVKTDEKWSEIFKEVEIKVKVEYNIERAGMQWK